VILLVAVLFVLAAYFNFSYVARAQSKGAKLLSRAFRGHLRLRLRSTLDSN
jgi:hypothetical protein